MTRGEIEKAIQCCNPYDENCGDCPFHDLPLGRCFEKLASSAFNMLLEDRERLQKQVKAYQDKIEQGTLIEIPTEEFVFHISKSKNGNYVVREISKYYYMSVYACADGIMNKWFSTREEAEKKLKELQE